MNSRSVPLHLVLLILALAGAWLTFRGTLEGDSPSDPEGVVLLQAAEGDVERVVYESNGRTVRLEARRDPLGRWFEGTESVAASAPADTGPADGDTRDGEPGDDQTVEPSAAGPPETEPTAQETERLEPDESASTGAEIEVFRGGAAVTALWRQLEPFRVKRLLGQLDAAKLTELELDQPAASLTLTLRGRAQRFALGAEVFGSSDRYARTDDDRVVVLPAALTRDLESGRWRLQERRLVEATRPGVDALELSRGAKTARIVQRDAAQLLDATWSLEGEEEARGEFGTWVDKFFRLEAVGYRSGEPGADWRSEATLRVESREYGVESLEIWSLDEEDERVWLARSASTRLVVELDTLAEELCQDLDSLLP